MNILNIPAYFNFLKSLYKFTISKTNDNLEISNFTILLPSRRSCNELKRIFLENSINNAIILPNIKAIGDIDYDDLVLKKITKNDLENFSNISFNTSRIKYKILLIKELLKWAKSTNKELFKNITIEQASNLSLELEKFLNDINKHGLDLNNLQNIVDDEYSKHWQEVLNFLEIFSKKWNNFIKENNVISNINYKTKMIELNSQYFEKNKPNNPIIIAGVSGNIKNTCDLIKNIVKYDNCYYVFNGLNKLLNDEEWDKVGVFHPQYSFKNLLLNCICTEREKVKDLIFDDCIITDKNIEKILNYSMLPHTETYRWKEDLNIKASSFSHISKIECNNTFEELSIISMILKYHNDTTNYSIGVITFDEIFANQLEVNLKSLNLNVNNVFGNKISRTDFVKYLFLILDVIKSDFEPISFLSLLKYKFTLFNYTKDELNQLTLLLEDNILRASGDIGLNEILKKAKEYGNKNLIEFIENIKNLLLSFKFKDLTFQNILKLHIELAEKISTNAKVNGSNIFWKDEKDGNELLNFFSELVIESESYGLIENLDEYSYLLTYLIAENSYSNKYSIHPMINILSPQEAKLINYDLIIVSNLNDGIFPPHISTDPWMSKSMRKSFGLPDKDELIGIYAFEFTNYLNNKEVILTRSIKENGVPTTKSKYLMRLETFLLCQNSLILKNGNDWKLAFNKYNIVENKIFIKRPKPTPPIDKRPRKLYATKIEKLMNNPYDIYAEKILHLKNKDDFYKNNIFALFGTAVHEALEMYIKNYEKLDKTALQEKLMDYGKKSFDKYFFNDSSKKLFFIRFSNIANWFVNEDEQIRSNGYKIFSERVEKLYLNDLDFTLSAKIDRIEENKDKIVNIIDYKTGNSPSNTEVLSGKKPQLVIEAIIMEDKKINKLAYWSIKGKGSENIYEINGDMNELIEKGKKGISKLINHFDIYENSYIATSFDLNPQNNTYSDYKHLSRVEEWGYL